jgi:hypothetical protein
MSHHLHKIVGKMSPSQFSLLERRSGIVVYLIDLQWSNARSMVLVASGIPFSAP